MADPTLRYYACGETDQELASIYRNHEKQLRTFSAGVFLFEHSSGERILFDTGYSTSIYDIRSLRMSIYRKILPPRVREKDNIANQLLDDGVDPSSIGSVVLSHLHPDHIGGVQFFPNARFVMSQSAAESLAEARTREAIFPELLPKWFKSAPKTILGADKLTSTSNDFVKGYDFFGDKSFLLTELPGHARGHIGAFVLDRLLLAGDASWGKDLLEASHNTRFVTKIANFDINAYRSTIHRLQALEAQGVELCFSHDRYNRRSLIP